ncbi:MAG TPA: GNAT family N-acetyltransferase [Candidatus Paceibacterota bacterium]|jgi:ribosomal protein S18 acetylase RimI-like enzyme|nr:GNAT family N-acetyltransferase [Candidatus Paceibacterota bacterium]
MEQKPDQEKLSVKIEIAKPGDEQACKDLILEALTGPDKDMFNFTPEELNQINDLDWWKVALSPDNPDNNGRFFVLAWSGSEAAGIGRVKPTDEEGVWTMGAFYVKPEFQGKFFPRKVLTKLSNEIQNRGGSKVIINVSPENERAVSLYEALGFKPIPSNSIGYNEMELDLTPTDKKLKPDQEKLNIEIRLANAEDWEACRDLRIEAVTGEDAKMFGVTPENREKRIIKETRNKDEWISRLTDKGFGFLAWNGSEAVGVGLAIKDNINDEWFMYGGYVRENTRGGVGRKIFAMRLNEILKRGGHRVTMGVKVINGKSIHIAESFGFKRIEKDASPEGFFMLLEDVNNPEVIGKINQAINAR